MLRQLYELGIHGHFEEFLSYRILYLLHTRNRGGQWASSTLGFGLTLRHGISPS